MTSAAGDRGRYRLRSRESKSLRGNPPIFVQRRRVRPGSLTDAGDRIAPARPERLAGDLESGRHLPPLVLAGPYPAQDVGDDRGREAAFDDGWRVQPIH